MINGSHLDNYTEDKEENQSRKTMRECIGLVTILSVHKERLTCQQDIGLTHHLFNYFADGLNFLYHPGNLSGRKGAGFHIAFNP